MDGGSAAAGASACTPLPFASALGICAPAAGRGSGGGGGRRERRGAHGARARGAVGGGVNKSTKAGGVSRRRAWGFSLSATSASRALEIHASTTGQSSRSTSTRSTTRLPPSSCGRRRCERRGEARGEKRGGGAAAVRGRERRGQRAVGREWGALLASKRASRVFPQRQKWTYALSPRASTPNGSALSAGALGLPSQSQKSRACRCTRAGEGRRCIRRRAGRSGRGGKAGGG